MCFAKSDNRDFNDWSFSGNFLHGSAYSFIWCWKWSMKSVCRNILHKSHFPVWVWKLLPNPVCPDPRHPGPGQKAGRGAELLGNQKDVKSMPEDYPGGSFEDVFPATPWRQRVSGNTSSHHAMCYPDNTRAYSTAGTQLGPREQPQKFQLGPLETINKASVELLLPRSSRLVRLPRRSRQSWAVMGQLLWPTWPAASALVLWPCLKGQDRWERHERQSNLDGIKLLWDETWELWKEVFNMSCRWYCIWFLSQLNWGCRLKARMWTWMWVGLNILWHNTNFQKFDYQPCHIYLDSQNRIVQLEENLGNT